MNVWKPFLVAAGLLFSLNASAQKAERVTLEVKTNIYCDHCQRCESCGTRIYNQLIDMPGVRKVRVDDESEVIRVTYMSDKQGPKAIRDAINAAGFNADDQMASAEQVAGLDQCCRKK
jgi:copper chaperone CopZ